MGIHTYTSSIIFRHKTLNTSERALECDGEEPDAVHAAAARGGDHRRQEAQDTQDHQLDQAGHQHSFNFDADRDPVPNFHFRIRDLRIIKVIRICDQ